MDAQELHNLQEAYLEVYSEGYVNPFKAPPAHGRTLKGDPSKGQTLGNPARLSPAMRALQRSDQLRATEPGSRRQQAQTRRSTQLNRMFQSARNAPGGRGGGLSAPGVGSPSGTSPAGIGRPQVGGGQGYGLLGIKLADEYDLYDIILSHLLDEGYADTQKAAEVMMVNMSEEWRQSIINENLVDVAKRGVDVIRNPIGTAVRDIGAAAKGSVKRVIKPYIDASQKEQDMKHPKYNPSTGKIDPNYNPRSSMR